MDKSKKDEIILQQLDVIRTMSEHNLSRMGTDFWGSPLPVRKEEDQPGSAASTGNDDTKAPPAEDAAPPEKIEDLQAELDGYIGLAAVKKEVKNLINMVTVYKLRRDNGLPTTDLSLHMVFSGNPGTGKTTIARIMARIYHSLGILSKGQLVEVDRSGLVAGYVGQTALKTSKVIDSALGGVLFIDEAYALNGRAENDFGQEAIDTILKAMEDHRDDLVVIVAGYDGLMDAFIHSNPGLESRFNRFLHFDDYSVDEMLEIFKMQCNKGCYELGDGVEQQLREFIAEENTNSISFGNARGVRNLFERILVNQANRLAALDTVTREDLMKITTRDVALARGLEEESCAAQEGTPDTPEGREMAQESKLDTPPSGGLGEDLK
ncbi:AAA family ATPase [Oscillibacter hominis]|uniref:AAA family ATPase n=1 Tax=Oscillibacter hominis TaxID=2763056 RepID=A0A7G9B4G5_9FIRM|nr:AAA family ATPase [Oscillibacter hominis]QNL44446.1 AAA family ATPase [Oscillibacter hominis]